MREQLQPTGRRPRPLDRDLADGRTHHLALAQLALVAAHDLDLVGRKAELRASVLRVQSAMFVTHRRRRDAQGPVVQGRHERVRIDEQPRCPALLRVAAEFAAAHNRGDTVDVEADVVVAGLAVVRDHRDLAALMVGAQAGAVRHPYDLETHDRLDDLERLGHDFHERVEVGAVVDPQVFAVGEPVRRHRVRQRRQRCREVVSDVARRHSGVCDYVVHGYAWSGLRGGNRARFAIHPSPAVMNRAPRWRPWQAFNAVNAPARHRVQANAANSNRTSLRCQSADADSIFNRPVEPRSPSNEPAG